MNLITKLRFLIIIKYHDISILRSKEQYKTKHKVLSIFNTTTKQRKKKTQVDSRTNSLEKGVKLRYWDCSDINNSILKFSIGTQNTNITPNLIVHTKNMTFSSSLCSLKTALSSIVREENEEAREEDAPLAAA